MTFARTIGLACLPIISLATFASALPEEFDWGTIDKTPTDIIERVEGNWTPVESCTDFIFETNGLTFNYFSARQNGEPRHINIACEMEPVGNKVIGWYRAKAVQGSQRRERSYDFYLIRLVTGDEVIVDGSGVFSDMSDNGNQRWQIAKMQRVWNPSNGRVFFDHNDEMTAEHPFTAWLLGNGSFDLSELGISTGLAPVAPTAQDVARGLRARVRQLYERGGCRNGFASRLTVSPVDVCVNFDEFENVSCEPASNDGRRYTCDFSMVVFARSGSTPRVNNILAQADQPWRLTGYTFTYDDADGWLWDTDDDTVHDIVPTDFRIR